MNEDKSKKENLFVGTLKECCSKTTCHAIPYIASTQSYFIKIFWTLLFLAALGGGAYFCYKSMITYFENGITVSFNYIQESSSTFPAITVCNLNAFDLSSSTIKAEINKAISAYNLSLNIDSTSNTSQPISQLKSAITILKIMAKQKNLDNKKSTSSNNTNFGFDIKNMLISCEFDGVTCSSSDFIKSYSFEYINCYTFNKYNGSDLKYVTRRKAGLSLELFAGLESDYTFDRGFYIAVHNNSFDALTRYEGIKIPVGYETDIAIKRSFYTKLSSPFSNCRMDIKTITSSDSTYFKYILNSMSYTTYSKDLCYEVCYQDLINKNCNCSDGANFITIDSSKSVCSSTQMSTCGSKILAACASNGESCSCSSACPEPCYTVNYETTLSSAVFPSQYYFNIMKQRPLVISNFADSNLTIETYKNSMAMVNLYYDSLKYISVEESPTYEPSDLVGILGGIIGLFIGTSLLSFCEIIDFWIVYWERMYKQKNKNKIETNLNK